MIGKTISHYKILEVLRNEGLATVYLAEDQNVSRRVAIKLLDMVDTNPELRQRFLREADSHARLSHPNITPVYEVDKSGDQPFVVMEYVEGQTLGELARSDSVCLLETLELVIQACEGLQAAHAQGVVHRCINPDNLMVASDRKLRIQGFGEIDPDLYSTRAADDDHFAEVAPYMSPEEITSEKIGPSSDIFSLGVVLYELVAGRLPFEGDSALTTAYEIVHTEQASLNRYSRDVSPVLEQTVSRCLAKRPDERYQSMSDLLADLRRIKRELESGVRSGIPSVSARKRRVAYVVTGLVVITVAILLVAVNPFNWKVVEDPGAIAAENSLAVMYFDNLVDPQDSARTGDILTSLVITDLSESEFLRVTNKQRLFDILQQIGHDHSRSIDAGTATQVAEIAAVNYIVTGEVLRSEPTLSVTARISEARTGRNVATHRVAGTQTDDVFSIADKVSKALKNDLDLPSIARSEPDRPVAEVTTQSPEAYRYYLDGRDYQMRFKPAEAVASYRKALEYDSSFAMAHHRLAASIGAHILSRQEQQFHLNRAAECANHATWKEQRLIDGLVAAYDGDQTRRADAYRRIVERYPDDKEGHAYFAHALYRSLDPDIEGAVAHFEAAIELDPQYGWALSQLTRLYLYNVEDPEKALAISNQHLAAAPEDAEAHFKRGEILQLLEKYDEAIVSFEHCLTLNPDLYYAHFLLGGLYLFEFHDYEKARDQFLLLSSHSLQTARWVGRGALPLIPLYRGQFAQGLALLDEAISTDSLEFGSLELSTKRMATKVRVLTELGQWEAALTELHTYDSVVREESPADSVIWFLLIGMEALARSGALTEADSLLGVLLAMVNNSEDATYRDQGMAEYWLNRGVLQEARGRLTEAVASYDSSLQVMHPHWTYLSMFSLGRACLEAGDLGRATRTLQESLSHLDESATYHAFWVGETHYYLGVAFEQSGWKQEAIEEYETFLDIWSEADPGLEIVDDAQQRLAELGS